MSGDFLTITDHQHEMLDEFDISGAPAPTAARAQLPGTARVSWEELSGDHPPSPAVVDWWRSQAPWTASQAASLVGLSPLLDQTVHRFAGVVLDALGRLAPAPTDLLAVALDDARAALAASPSTAWFVPGARALSAVFLGGDPAGGLRVALGVSPGRSKHRWPPADEGPGPEHTDGEPPWREPVAQILTALWEHRSMIPEDARREALLTLAWHCGSDARARALSLMNPHHRRFAELAAAGGGEPSTVLERYYDLAKGGAAKARGGAEPAAPLAPPSPLHRWTWQRGLVFVFLLALSLWVYLKDT